MSRFLSNYIDGFKDGNNLSVEYTYDANGNMISDLNKGITAITYNHLNLPRSVSIAGQGSIEYVYDATGVKQSKKVSSLFGTPINTYYAGNFIYEFADSNAPELKFFSTPEGYVEPNSKSFDYIYQYKDHLGNVRLSYKNPNDSYQNIIDSDLTNSYEGWFHAGNVTSELINGTLKVDVDAAWEGVQHHLNNLLVAPGDVFKVKLIFDKGNTQSNVRFYFQELDANGNHLSWNTLNGNLLSGTYEYTYTVNTGNKLILRIDKDDTNTSTLTSFYIDYVSVTSGELEIVEENNYYPFGLKHKGYNTNITSTNIALKRKFGGKEYQDELGLDWYDITARNYDPALGRWMNIDPLAEQMRRHSPYNYAFNNPLRFIDPDGLSPDDVIITGTNPAVKEFEKEILSATGGFFSANIDSKTGELSLKSTGIENLGLEMTAEQKAFTDKLQEMIDSPIVVEHEIVMDDINVDVDKIETGQIDISDVQEFDKAGKGGTSSRGALIHATVEQHEKIKAGGIKGTRPPESLAKKFHYAGIQAENPVNGNQRGVRGNEDFFLESNGRVTSQLIIRGSTIKVIKNDIGVPK